MDAVANERAFFVTEIEETIYYKRKHHKPH